MAVINDDDDDDELHSLYSSPNTFRVIKSRRMRWVGHVACMEEGRGVCRVLFGGLKARDHWEDLGCIMSFYRLSFSYSLPLMSDFLTL
jgi:hypothetical protein